MFRGIKTIQTKKHMKQCDPVQFGMIWTVGEQEECNLKYWNRLGLNYIEKDSLHTMQVIEIIEINYWVIFPLRHKIV